MRPTDETIRTWLRPRVRYRVERPFIAGALITFAIVYYAHRRMHASLESHSPANDQ